MSEAKMKVSRGFTLNIGNYESARFDLEIERVVAVDELDEVFGRMDHWLKSVLEEEAEKIQVAAKTKPLPVERFTGGTD